MRIVCPACEAEYDVPDALLGGGHRKVRCARCAREWEPFAPPPPPPPVAPLAVAIEAAAELPPLARAPLRATLADHLEPIAPPRERATGTVPGGPPGMGLVIAWLVSGAIVIACVGVLWLKRQDIVHFWPPAARLYKLFGLDF